MNRIKWNKDDVLQVMCDIFKYSKRASYACASSHVSNNKRVGKTCYQKITYVYRVSNMDRVEFKELHITTVYFWAQIFLNLHFNRGKMCTILYMRVKKWFGSIFQIFSQRCSSESTSSILDTLYVVNKEDPIKIFFWNSWRVKSSSSNQKHILSRKLPIVFGFIVLAKKSRKTEHILTFYVQTSHISKLLF